jgi:hypothetical protein
MRSILLAACAALTLMASTSALAQQVVVDHRAYDALLRQHVVDGLVDYDAFAADTTFARYLASLDRVDPSLLEQDERLAFWINVYNAFTIRLITTHGERESIRNINRTFGVLRLKGPWTTPVVRAAGRTLTLDQVQYEMIRRESSDPRLHFALSCGAVSCPPLRSEAYTGAALEEQLQDQGRRFLVESSARNRFELETRTFHRNIVFKYFANDFGDRRELGQFLAQWYNDSTPLVRPRFRPPGMARRDSIQGIPAPLETLSVKGVVENGRFRVADLPFNWSLNAMSMGGRKPD